MIHSIFVLSADQFCQFFVAHICDDYTSFDGSSYAEMKAKLKIKGLSVGNIHFDKHLALAFCTAMSAIEPGCLWKATRGMKNPFSTKPVQTATRFKTLFDRIKTQQPKYPETLKIFKKVFHSAADKLF